MNVCKIGPLASGIGFFLFLSGAAHAQSGQMVNAMDGLCLQVNGPIAAGSRLQIATCTGTPNQLFTKTAANELRMNGNLCVDAYGGGKQAAEVGLWNCQGSPNERWAPNNGMLVTENGFCMAVDGGRHTPGTRIIIYTCYPNDNSQKFSGPVAQRAAVPAPPPTTAPTPAPVAAAAQLDPGNLSAACQMVYGRACTVEETAYVRSTPPSTYSTREGIMAFLRTKVTQSAVVRDGMITRAVELTYGPNTQICTEAWDFLRSSFTTNANNQPGSAWNGVNQLYYGNPAMLTTVVTTRCRAAAPRTPGQAFDPSIARAACQTMFGRDCTAEENAQLGSAVGGNNRDAMQAYLRDKIAASPSLKDNVITAAYAMVMGAGRPICTEEMNDLRARFMSLPQPGTTWNGFAGLAFAAGGSPPLVQARASLCAAPAATRVSSATLSMIAGSYVSDFGRPATTQETTYWASVNPNDPRIASRAAFLQNDRTFLQTNQTERRNTITASYMQVFKKAPDAAQMQFWEGDLVKNGRTYDELVAAHRQYVAANPAPVAPVITPVTPVTPLKPTGPEPLRKGFPEYCFGAVGQGCQGAGAKGSGSTQVMALGVGCGPEVNGYRNCFVAPGSIMHDNCCIRNPGGLACGGDVFKGVGCEKEWHQAEKDVATVRIWIAPFASNVPADLTPVASTRVPKGETVSTKDLCAPGGTNISEEDGPEFCCSKQFKEKWWVVGGGAWGVCSNEGTRLLQSASEAKEWKGPPVSSRGPSQLPPPPSPSDIMKAQTRR